MDKPKMVTSYIDDMFAGVKSRDARALESAEKKARADLEKLIHNGKKCLSNEDFVVYRKKLELATNSILEVMIHKTRKFFAEDGGDMAKYGAMMARYLTKLEDMRLLLDNVELYARKQLSAEVEDAG